MTALPESDYDDAMVTPALLALLLPVFEARRQLGDLELAPAETRFS